MKQSHWYSGGLLAVALSAVLGYLFASSRMEAPLNAAVASHARANVARQFQPVALKSAAGSSGLSQSEEALLISHNQTVASTAARAGKKPNIMIIWGDDVGWNNTSAYNRGMMGYSTPNIDRIAREGGLFTDWYGQQSCTAGRAAFITGQSPFRTGLLKVGLPGAKEGLSVLARRSPAC